MKTRNKKPLTLEDILKTEYKPETEKPTPAPALFFEDFSAAELENIYGYYYEEELQQQTEEEINFYRSLK